MPVGVSIAVVGDAPRLGKSRLRPDIKVEVAARLARNGGCRGRASTASGPLRIPLWRAGHLCRPAPPGQPAGGLIGGRRGVDWRWESGTARLDLVTWGPVPIRPPPRRGGGLLRLFDLQGGWEPSPPRLLPSPRDTPSLEHRHLKHPTYS
jgi:hypothetical protein